MATAWTQDDLAKLEKAIASGARSVSYQGETVTYRSMDEMLRARDMIRKELGLAGSSHRRYARTLRGLH